MTLRRAIDKRNAEEGIRAVLHVQFTRTDAHS